MVTARTGCKHQEQPKPHTSDFAIARCRICRQGSEWQFYTGNQDDPNQEIGGRVLAFSDKAFLLLL